MRFLNPIRQHQSNRKHGRSRRNRRAASNNRRPRLEPLEKRALLAGLVTESFQTDLFFDQFGGGDARVFHHGYDKLGNESAEFFGLEVCRATSCGGQPIEVGNYPDAFSIGADAEFELKLGVEYGVYANAGSASLDYDGTFQYEVIDHGGGPIQIATNVDYSSGALFTQSPTAEAFADLVLIADASVSGGACAFGGCVDGTLDFPRIEERVELIGLNRGKSGQIGLLGTSLIEQGLGVYDRVSGGREDQQGGRRDQYKSDRDLALANTEAERNAALQRRDAADNRIAVGQTAEANAKSDASNAAKGKKFGGGQILQVSFGEDPGELLGAELELSVGTGVPGGANISKRLGALSVTVPDIALADTTLGSENALSAATKADDPRRNVANLNLDLGAIIGGGFGLGETRVDIGPLSIGLTTVSYDLDTSLKLNQEVEAKPNEKLRFDFQRETTRAPFAVDLTLNGTAINDVTTIDFLPGDDVRVVPQGSEKIIVQPSLVPTYEFSNDMGLDLDITGTLRALELALSGLGLDEVWGPLIEIETPLADFDLASLLDETFEVSADPIPFAAFEIGGPQSDLNVELGRASGVYEHDVMVTAPLIVRNDGPDPATGIVVTARVPSELELDLDQLPAGCSFQETFGSGVLTCTTPELAVGNEFSFELDVTPNVRIPSPLTMPLNVESASRDPSPFTQTREIFVQKGLRISANLKGDGLSSEQTYDDRKFFCEVQNSCSFRSAIERANRNPGHDVILLDGFGDYGLRKPLEITDSVTIVGRQGSFIHPDRVSSFATIDSSASAWLIEGVFPAQNGTVSDVSARELVSDLNNRGSLWVPEGGARYPISAELTEGSGRGLIPFDSDQSLTVQADELEMIDGKAVATFVLPGDNNDLRITLENPVGDAASLSSLETLELQLGTRESPRHPLLLFNGDGMELAVHGIGIRDGNASQGDDATGVGGAISVTGTGNHLLLSNTRLQNNYSGLGGAVFMQDGKLTIRDAYFIDNQAEYQGGGVAVENVDVTIEDSFFLRNESTTGGAIFASPYAASSMIDATRSLFVGNEAGESGAVVEVDTLGGADVNLVFEESSLVGSDSLYYRQIPERDGSLTVMSRGGNLSDLPLEALNDASDRVGDAMTLSSTSVPVNQPGAIIGDLSFRLAGFAVDGFVEFQLDDPRFEIVAGQLKLIEDATFENSEPPLTLTVTAINQRGDTSPEVFVLSGLAAPAAVSGLTISPDENTVALSWTAVDGVTGYRVIQIDDQGNETVLRTVDDYVTSAVADGYAPQTSLSFQIEAFNDAGASRSPILATTTLIPIPSLAADVFVESLSPTSLELTWSSAAYAQGYAVYVDGNLLAELPAAATQFLIEDLAPNRTIEITVAAFNQRGESVIEPRTITTPPLAPEKPAAFDTRSAENGVLLTWDPVLDAGEYRIFRGVDGAPVEEIALLPGDATQFLVSDFEADRTYEFELRVYNRSGALKSLTIAGEFANAPDVNEIILSADSGLIDPAEEIAHSYDSLQAVRIRGDVAATISLNSAQFDTLSKSNELALHLQPEHALNVGQGWSVADPVYEDDQFFRTLVNGARRIKLDRIDAYRNPLNAFDVDNSGEVRALDALVIINRLSLASGELAPPTADQLSNFHFIDVSGDGSATPIDALQVINQLSRIAESESTEGLIAVSISEREEAVDAIFRQSQEEPQLF